MTRRETAVLLAERLLYKPYVWGGDNPNEGFDCSGFIIELLKSVGILPAVGDWSADALLGTLVKKPKYINPASCRAGDLVFYGVPAHHVEMVFENTGDRIITIGAMGGGSGTTNLAEAIKQDAFIKVRPLKESWGAPHTFVNPFED